MLSRKEVRLGDAFEVLKEYPDNFFDAVVTDPPYGLGKEPNISKVLSDWLVYGRLEANGGKGFMGMEWDAFVPGPHIWREVNRVLKPGGYLLSFAGTRTADLMGISLRLAGFNLLGTLQWIYGNGFPKSHNIAKAIDKTLGHEPVIVEKRVLKSGGFATVMRRNQELGYRPTDYYEGKGNIIQVTRPATKEAREWEGWGTSLKPAFEPIMLAQKAGGNCNGDASPAVVLDRQPIPRFFYVPKASTKERSMNGRVNNTHPTVKPIGLMYQLLELVLPPGGIVLDPFCGSGTTLLAALIGGWQYVGIDKQESYVSLTNERIACLEQDLVTGVGVGQGASNFS